MSETIVSRKTTIGQIFSTPLATSVEYNRSEKRWELLGQIGEVIDTFPPGPAGRRDALIAQLEIEAPEAGELALKLEKQFKRLKGRALRGALLVASGHVLATDQATRWRVRSQSRPAELYTVHELKHSYRWHCTCADWSNGETGAQHGAPRLLHDGKYSPICKHILAVLIARYIEDVANWPPSCPECGLGMVVKRHYKLEERKGIPFWSCRNFPHCKGDREFKPHPEDLVAARGKHQEALFLSMERVQTAGLYQPSIVAQRRQRRREVEAARIDAAAGKAHQAADDRDAALPVQHTTGRNKLFKT